MKYLNYPERVAIPGKEYEKLWQKYQTEGIPLREGRVELAWTMPNVWEYL